MASSGGGLLSGLLGGGSMITQVFLWQVLGQIIGALLGPYITQATYDVNKAHPIVQPSTPDLADMVVRGILTEQQAAAIAVLWGENSETFHNRVLDTGEPPGLESILEWWRRGFLGWDDTGQQEPSVVRAIKTSRIYNYWTPVIQQSQFLPISVADAINAWVRGQVDQATAEKYAYAGGIKPEEAQILYNTTGRPASPMELAEGVRRGFIPLKGRGPLVLSLEQGIIEGDLKDKWEPFFEHLVTRLPSMFQVGRMLSAGAISPELATQTFTQLGVPENLIAGLVAAGSGEKLAGSKKLAQGVIEALYRDRAMDQATAEHYLEQLGYDATEAGFVLSVVDLALVQEQYSAAITKTRTAFLARRINKTETLDVLHALGVPAAQEQQLLGLWEDEMGATIRVLSEAQIVAAVEYGVASVDWALQKLEGLGYTAGDAWVLVSVRLHGPAGSPPAGAPQPPQPAARAPTPT